jgi:hypothetical protein
MADKEPYYYVRFRWWSEIDIEKIYSKLGSEFKIVKEIAEPPDDPMSLHTYNFKEFQVKADTLYVALSPLRAILFQKEKQKFTKSDIKLRERIFELYPKDRPSPFPWLLSGEPKFDVEEK